MKKYFLLIAYLISLFTFSSAQNPLVKQWDKRFGGFKDELLTSFKQTADGGYILGGYSYSDSSGDKTQANRDTIGYTSDFWIIKTDSLGAKQWDKTFGGIKNDMLYSVQQTSDGGFILGGQSKSGISGDKTQPNWDPTETTNDYWMVKTDAMGNKLWDKRFGGNHEDWLYSLVQTSDGGYILGGYSQSDVSGDKTQPRYGTDFWIVKTDAAGNKLWDRDFGSPVCGTECLLYDLQQTYDGGYILGGRSSAGVGGDKSQPNWDPTCQSFDYWILKTDSLGIKQWDKRFGGTDQEELSSLKQTADGGYILGGFSWSAIGGDKTQNTWGTKDYWIVKVDSSGIKQWDKDFGGNNLEESCGNISQTADGGYLFAGASASNISGDKTENNLGPMQTWVIKTNSLGIKQWDKTIFTTGNDGWFGYAIQINNGCYAIANSTNDSLGGYKTQPNWDTACTFGCTYDYWIIKFCDTTLSTSIHPISNFQFPISISPNPFNESLVISSELGEKNKYEIEIKDIEGRVLLRTPNSKLPAKLDLDFLSKGIYLLEVNTGDKQIVKKIVKE